MENGDYVLAENPETGEQEYKRVANTYIHENDVIVHVRVGDEKIETTREHPFYVEGVGFVQAESLKPGDKVRLADGRNLEVCEIDVEYLSEPVYVYNFEVEDYHTYFVSELGVLVHNECGTADLYHYTTKEGADGIKQTGIIKPDAKGRVYVTTDEISADDVNNALFMGQKPNAGEYVVEINLFDKNDFKLSGNGTTQPNELIYNGAIRDGRNADIIIKENDF